MINEPESRLMITQVEQSNNDTWIKRGSWVKVYSDNVLH